MDDLLPEKKDYRFAFMPEKETAGNFLEYIDEVTDLVFEGETGDPEIVLQFADKKLDLTFCPEVMEILRQAVVEEKEYQEELKGELSMPKILLETEFEDSTLEKEMFRVKITRYDGNIVFGDAVEVEIRHPEEDFLEVYSTEEFPDQFYADLDFRGWDFVLEEIKERL